MTKGEESMVSSLHCLALSSGFTRASAGLLYSSRSSSRPKAGFDFLDLEVVLPSISLLGVGLELGNY